MSLTQAIDAAIAFVDAHEAIPIDQHPQFDVSHFEALSRVVYVEAYKLRLHDELPPPDDSSISKTNLPGTWMLDNTFIPNSIRYWKAEMLALRALAEAGSTPEAESAAEQPSAEQQMERVAQAVGDDNAARILAIAGRKDWPGERKMEEILRVDRRYAGKDSVEWSTLLGVSAAAVRGYDTWKDLHRG